MHCREWIDTGKKWYKWVHVKNDIQVQYLYDSGMGRLSMAVLRFTTASVGTRFFTFCLSAILINSIEYYCTIIFRQISLPVLVFEKQVSLFCQNEKFLIFHLSYKFGKNKKLKFVKMFRTDLKHWSLVV